MRSNLSYLWRGFDVANTPWKWVEWTDIHSNPGWNEEEQMMIGPVRRIVTGGWILYDGEDPLDPGRDILIAAGTYIFDEGVFADFTVYPRGCVKGLYDRLPKRKKT